MAADNNPANDPPFDPLTSPAWMLEEDDDILLAPPLEAFFSDVAAAKSPGPVAPPPKIDDIITGGYTGWVPIIKAGESLAQAEARAAQVQNPNTDSKTDEIVEVAIAQTIEAVEIEPTSAQSVSKPIVDDPDLVTSPSQALDQARKRIAAMRASLQLNLNQVAESFAHPIFTPPSVVTSPAQETTSVQQPVAPTVQPYAPTVTETDPQIPFTSPPTTRVFTPTETQTQPEAEVQTAPADHSLELMIMRDEIKDLRDRLDSSQKLIEELMHRLANLAELALKRQ